MLLPFVVMLLSIALMPFLAPKFWEHHYPKVAVALGAITVCYYLFGLHAPDRVVHTAIEYVSFISLIGSLFVVAGGIHIAVKGESTPWVNCLFLFMGAVLANIIGTTGASMLLIRPWIRMNRYRITAYHVVFFIFIISNVGGVLTPIGDPPLFLGFLKGVPFFWPTANLWPAWLIAIGLLITVFYIIDRRNFLRAPEAVREMETANEEFRVTGLRNIWLIAVILGAVFVNSPLFLREGIMLAAAAASWFVTPKVVHERNKFNFHPIKEVGWLFVGIFATMIPALDYLELHANEFAIETPMQYYWMTGALSSVLDNAPTYLSLLAADLGHYHLTMDDKGDILRFVAEHVRDLMAISIGAVFFGAMTYIGNGPNFLVKSIAEHSKVNCPDFFGYIFRFAVPILLPILAVIALLYFSPWAVL